MGLGSRLGKHVVSLVGHRGAVRHDYIPVAICVWQLLRHQVAALSVGARHPLSDVAACSLCRLFNVAIRDELRVLLGLL